MSIISLVAGMVMMSLYVFPSRLALIVPAAALFIVIFYLSLFGMARSARENFLAVALLTSAIWVIGRGGFLPGRLLSKKHRA